MADFREKLMVRCTNDFLGIYMYTWAKYDLAVSDTEPIKTKNDFGISLGEACKVIDDFTSSSLSGRKLSLRAFLEANEYTHEEEY